MSHIEYRNGALVEVDDKTGEVSSITPHFEDIRGPIVLSGSTKPLEIGYKPTNCSEMIATRELLQYYSDLMYSCQTDYCKIKYQKICAVLEARLEDMEQRLLYEAKD